MTKKTPNLRRRGARFYYRQRVPTDIRGRFAASEVSYPLFTGDFETARRRAKLCAMAADELFDSVRDDDTLSAGEIVRLVRAFFDETLARISHGGEFGTAEDGC